MLQKIIKNAIVVGFNNSRENFSMTSTSEEFLKQIKIERMAELISALIVYILYIVIVLLVGKFLWNRVVAGSGSGKGLFTFVKPVNSIIELLGLYVFTMIYLQ